MASGAVQDVVDAGVGLLRAGVDGLLAADLASLSEVEVAGLLEAVEVERRRLDAAGVALVAAAEER
jgi:hypothetical protein